MKFTSHFVVCLTVYVLFKICINVLRGNILWVFIFTVPFQKIVAGFFYLSVYVIKCQIMYMFLM